MENITEKTPKKTLWLRILCIAVAVLLLAAIPVALGPVVEPKYLTTSKEGSLTEEYYASVAETNHDVLFIGDCEVFEAFVPAVRWEGRRVQRVRPQVRRASEGGVQPHGLGRHGVVVR